MSGGTIGQLSPDGSWRWDGASWVPADRTNQPLLPSWLPTSVRSSASWRVLLIATLVGLLVDQAWRVNALGLGAGLAVTAAAGGLWISGGARSAQARALLVLSVVFGASLAVRATPWLTIPDLAVSIVLLASAPSLGDRGSLFDLGFTEAGARVLHGVLHLALGASFAATPIGAVWPRLVRTAPIARGLLIGVPMAILIGVLLASADPVFASFFAINLDLGQAALDAIYVLAGGVVMCGLLRLAAAQRVGRVDGPRRRLGLPEGLVVIGILDALFAAFAIAQVVAASGNGAQVLHRVGMTYADYARSGFFQLLWVAGITLVLLVLFSRITDGEGRGAIAFRALSGMAIVLTLLIVYVSFQRLLLYEEAYGFTMLRLYSHIFAAWIGVLFLFLAADLLGAGASRRWLLGATSMAGLAVLMTLNVVNPEALVVRLNTDRAVSTHKLDINYLDTLSSDSVPALVSSATNLPADLRTEASGRACQGAQGYRPAWASFNLADSLAARARRQSCQTR